MEIWEDEKIASLPVRVVREILLLADSGSLPVKGANQKLLDLGISLPTATKMLIKLGYLQRHSVYEEALECSIRGKMLIGTSIKRTLSCERIRLLKEVLSQRIQDVNNSRRFTYKVAHHRFDEEKSFDPKSRRRLILYIAISPKMKNPEKQRKAEDKRRQVGSSKSRNYVEYAYFPQTEVLEFIRHGLQNVVIVEPYSNTIKAFTGRMPSTVTCFDEIW
jgi:hypothetical protein